MLSHQSMRGLDPQFADLVATRLRDSATPAAVAELALRLDSDQVIDVLARNATSGQLDLASVQALTARRGHATVSWSRDPAPALALARAVALRRTGPDPALGSLLFDRVWSDHGLAVFDTASLTLFAQLLARFEPVRLPTLLRDADLAWTLSWAVELDAANPFIGAGSSIDAWLASFNTMFSAHDLDHVTLGGSASSPFDRLSCRPASIIDDDEMVTVIMSAYRPDQSIMAAARSILDQSWSNIELLVVDDASPTESSGIFADLDDLDERIRVLRAPSNGGTYMVRNLALDHARGEYVTFQDSDDWSHARRIETQVAALRSDEALLATRSRALRSFPDLTFTYPGYPPERVNASSLLFRRQPVVERIGYFDTVRKSADIEYPERLQAAVPGSVLDLDDAGPLAICQLRRGSLSRGDAIPGWMHWSRLAYRNAYRARNAEIRAGTTTAYFDGDPQSRQLPLPDPSWSVRPILSDPCPHFDVVVHADWRRSRGLRRTIIDDIQAMLALGLRVGVINAETYDPLPGKGNRESLSKSIQELINAGSVELTHLTRPARADLVCVYDPTALQLISGDECALKVGRVAVLVSSAARGGVDVTYHVPDCDTNAERLFGRRPFWVPRDNAARHALSDPASLVDVADNDLALTYDPARLSTDVRRRGSDRPIIGRHVLDRPTRWPASADELLSAYPDDEAIDVRIAGGHRSVLRVLDRPLLPANWVSYGDGMMNTRTFLAQLDFFVYFPRHDATEIPGTAVLDAMASGCVVVLPPHFDATYGDGARYCDPAELVDVVSALHDSPDAFGEQQERARTWLDENHGPRAFQTGLTALLRT